MRTRILLSLILIIGIIKAQGLRISLIGNPQQTYLLNKADWETGDSLQPIITRRLGGGIGINYGILNRIFVGADILYSPEGQKYKGYVPNTGNTFEGFVELNYIKVPLYLNLSYPVFPKIHINLYGGPQIWFLISGKTTYYEYDKKSGKKIVDVYANKDSMVITSEVTFLGKTDTLKFVYPFDRIPHTIVMFGIWGGIGLGINITSKISADLNFRVDYSFTDNENKATKMDMGNGKVKELWAISSRFADFRTSPDFKASDRPKTHNFTLGLQLRLNYKLI